MGSECRSTVQGAVFQRKYFIAGLGSVGFVLVVSPKHPMIYQAEMSVVSQYIPAPFSFYHSFFTPKPDSNLFICTFKFIECIICLACFHYKENSYAFSLYILLCNFLHKKNFT